MTNLLAIDQFDTSVVIPVYFNEKSVAGVVERILAAWVDGGRSAEELEFVLVDDDSQDDSWIVLQTLRRRFPGQVTAVRLAKNHGSQLAFLAGASRARGRRVCIMAADGQEPPDLVPRMAHAADEGSRLVLAVRQSRADDVRTRVSAGFFYNLIRWLGLRNMPEQGFDAFLLDREMMTTILDIRDPNIPLAVTIAWLGYPYAEVHYHRLQRTEGRSRWTMAKKIKLFVDSFVSFSYVPIRTLSMTGFVVALGAFLYALFVLYERLVNKIPVQGYAPTVILLALFSGVQMVMIGVLGEYLWRALDETRRRRT